jgi:hypothetical protein
MPNTGKVERLKRRRNFNTLLNPPYAEDGPDHGTFSNWLSGGKPRNAIKLLVLVKTNISGMTTFRITVHFGRKMSDSVGITGNFSKMVIFLRFQKFQYFEKALGLRYPNMP